MSILNAKLFEIIDKYKIEIKFIIDNKYNHKFDKK